MSDDDEFLSQINLEKICEAKQKEEEKRFVEVCSGEINKLLSNVQSTNTKYKTTYAVNIFKGTFYSHINVYSKLINTTLHFIFSLDTFYDDMYFFP